MWALYRLDVTGPFSESLVETLVERLTMEPYSLYRAEQLGGPEWFGYGLQSELLMQVADELHLQTKVTAQRKGRLKPSEQRVRPKPEKPATIVSSGDAKGVAEVLAALNG